VPKQPKPRTLINALAAPIDIVNELGLLYRDLHYNRIAPDKARASAYVLFLLRSALDNMAMTDVQGQLAALRELAERREQRAAPVQNTTFIRPALPPPFRGAENA
jgi:hypothetical protein